MKKVCIITFLCMSLSSIALATTQSQSNQDYDALAQCAEKVIQTTAKFEEKYGNKQLLECNSCKKERLTHGDFLGWVLMQSLGSFIEPNKPNAAKKILDEALEIFPKKNLAELIPFMLNAANTLPLVCLRCYGKCWAIIEDKK